VALIPGQGSQYYGSGTAIIQIGIGVGTIPGTGTTPHFVWAAAGCNGSSPTAFDLGQADWNTHSYRADVYTGSFDLVLDGQVVVLGDSGHPATYALASCWVHTDKDIAILSEKAADADSYGSFNDGATSQAWSSAMKRKYTNTWFGLAGNVCEDIDLPSNNGLSSCTASGANMYVWSN
jgi:hypothetical protein